MKRNGLFWICIVIAVVLLITIGVMVLKAKGLSVGRIWPDNRPAQPEPEVIVIKESYDVEKGMEKAIFSTTLGDIQESGETNSGDDGIDFSDLPGVTYQKRGDFHEGSTTEAWVIKLGEPSQYETVLARVEDRVDELKRTYASDKKLSAIVGNKDNVVIRQREGIVIAVIAPDAQAIASSLVETVLTSDAVESEETDEELEEPSAELSEELVDEVA